MNGYTAALGKYAQFGGRARRAEYWGFVLVNALIGMVVAILMPLVGVDGDGGFTAVGAIITAVFGLYYLAILIPAIALQFRRYQDIGWPGAVSIVGWFVPFLTFVVACIPGNAGPNQYGPDPKG